MEHRNPATMGSLSIAGKLQASFFQSVTTRTAGFASISQSGLTNGSKFLACMLMIIGGSPAGTAGGIKTTTVAVLLLTAISVLRGNKDTECYGRKITFEIIRVGMTITLVTFVFWLFGVTVMTVIEPQQKVLDLCFRQSTELVLLVRMTGKYKCHRHWSDSSNIHHEHQYNMTDITKYWRQVCRQTYCRHF